MKVFLEMSKSEYAEHARDAKANGMSVEDHLLMIIRTPEMVKETKVATGELKAELDEQLNKMTDNMVDARDKVAMGHPPIVASGLTCRQVFDEHMMELQRKIKSDYANGKGLTTNEIEVKHSLRRSNGMTAWRILHRLSALKPSRRRRKG